MCLYAALSSGTMGVVSPITALGAIVPVVLGLVRGDAWTPSIGIGLLVALAGAVLASGPELSGDVGRRPVVLACISALGFGVSLYCMDGGARHDLSGAMLAMRCGSLTLLLPTLFALRSKGLAREPLTRRDVLVLPLLGMGDLTANLLFAAASAQGQVSIVAVLGSLWPAAPSRVIVVLWVLALPLLAAALLGVGLMTVSTAALSPQAAPGIFTKQLLGVVLAAAPIFLLWRVGKGRIYSAAPWLYGAALLYGATGATKLVEIVRGLRDLDLRKAPSISETIDWARTLVSLGLDTLDDETVSQTLGVVLKHHSDQIRAAAELRVN